MERLADPTLPPRHMLVIGIPAGGEFVLLAVYVALIYWIIRPFGAAAQAGFGLGSRLMQSIFLPAMAVAFAAAPIAGQNYGARLAGRVRATFKSAAVGCVGIMKSSQGDPNKVLLAYSLIYMPRADETRGWLGAPGPRPVPCCDSRR